MPGKTNLVSINSGGHRARVVAQRDELVLDHLSMAEGIARAACRHLPPVFDLDDLIAVANLALVRAATRYRPGEHNGAPFAAYARLVVRGAVIDSVRNRNWTEAMRPGLYQQGTDDAEEVEIAAAIRAATQPSAPEAIDRARLVERVANAIAWLSPKAQMVLREYYSANEPRLIDVAQKLHLTRRDVYATHKGALDRLRDRLKRAA